MGYKHGAPHTTGHANPKFDHEHGRQNANPHVEVGANDNQFGAKGNALRGPAKGKAGAGKQD